MNASFAAIWTWATRRGVSSVVERAEARSATNTDKIMTPDEEVGVHKLKDLRLKDAEK